MEALTWCTIFPKGPSKDVGAVAMERTGIGWYPAPPTRRSHPPFQGCCPHKLATHQEAGTERGSCALQRAGFLQRQEGGGSKPEEIHSGHSARLEAHHSPHYLSPAREHHAHTGAKGLVSMRVCGWESVCLAYSKLWFNSKDYINQIG